MARSPKTISHACNRCGNCCKHRDEDIFLTPFDVLRISVSINMSCKDFIEQYCLRKNFAEVCLKASGPEDECIFLTHSHSQQHCGCTIYSVRPMVCYLFPLGSAKLNTFFENDSPCCPTSAKPISVHEFVKKNSNSRYSRDFANTRLFLKTLDYLENHVGYAESNNWFEFLFYNTSEEEILKKLHSIS